MPGTPSKRALREELEQRLLADLAARDESHRAAVAAATHEEAKPENDKDTRALEQSYLARGEAARVEELRQVIAEVRSLSWAALAPDAPIGLGALVTASEDGRPVRLLLAPGGGGARLADGAVLVVTPRSPMGRSLVGLRAGDEGEVEVAGRSRSLEILAVE